MICKKGERYGSCHRPQSSELVTAMLKTAPRTRPRTDHNPLNRKDFLLHVVRRV
jgi:hypothetical protein